MRDTITFVPNDSDIEVTCLIEFDGDDIMPTFLRFEKEPLCKPTFNQIRDIEEEAVLLWRDRQIDNAEFTTSEYN